MKKRCILLFVSLTAMISLMTCLAFALTHTRTASLGDCNVTAKNNVEDTTGYARVSTDKREASAGLDSTYYYVDPSTNVVSSQRNYGTQQQGYSANFTAPGSCRTVQIITSYAVEYLGQFWRTSMTTIR
ncbi:MAG: hypothetical protein MJ064_07370 [Lachnospiraceae bacterium]|nr:hypothetical protein [Lachnospiraceae bacterium]